MKTFDLQRLRDADAASKPSDANKEWSLQHRLYEDCSRTDTLARLRQLGLGLAGNTRPLEVSLLDHIHPDAVGHVAIAEALLPHLEATP